MRRTPSSISIRPALWLLALVAAVGCSSTGAQGNDPDAGLPDDAAVLDDAGVDGAALACNVQAPTACPDPMPHFADVQPIIQTNCVLCHYGAVGGPWPLVLYEHVRDWQDVIKPMVLECEMPPADAGFTMSDADRLRILEWIRCGSPE